MDFSNAKLPALTALARSFCENALEEELNRLFRDVFSALLAENTFDANALGMAHIGSSALMSRAVTEDGLTIIDIGNGGKKTEAALRYIYRAWKSANRQGRGLYFLRVYLQLQFPNDWEVKQLWHSKEHAAQYPQHVTGESGADNFLTSRIRVRINAFPLNGVSQKITECLSMILPARIVPNPIEFSVKNDSAHIHFCLGQSARACIRWRTISVPLRRKIRLGQSARACILQKTYSGAIPL